MLFTANLRRQASSSPAISDSDALRAVCLCACPTVSKRSLPKKSRTQENQDNALREKLARPHRGRAFSFWRS
ncbi:hypothetical protein AZSP09_17220 [Azospira sp. I09]|jgi:hypothetical protein|nr:hypothetical protein AZSP09_17220 [Azospira sp. I09]